MEQHYQFRSEETTTKDSVIGFIKKYKRRDLKNKNLFYKNY